MRFVKSFELFAGRTTSLALLLGAGAALPAIAQCIPHWDTTLGGSTLELSAAGIRASLMFDDGSGPALFVAGEFQHIGGTMAFGIAKTHDGVRWEKLGDAFLFDAAQPFPFARIEAMTAFDPDGAGPLPPRLIVGGTFELADNGSTTVNHVAAWDGSTWSGLGGGLPGFGDGDFSVHVTSLATFDSGAGPRLYAGGNFSVGGIPNADVAVWNGTTWQPLGSTGTTAGGTVTDLIVHDDGSGPALYVAGDFDGIVGTPGTASIAKWNGSAWSSIGGGPTSLPSDHTINLVSFDADGPGGAPAKLLAFSWCTHRLDAWDGSSWTSTVLPSINWCGGKGGVRVFDDGSGPGVYFGGTMGTPQETHIIRYDGANFTILPDALLAADSSMSVATMAVNTLGQSPTLFVAGGTLGPDQARATGMLTFSNGLLSSVGPIGGPARQFNLFSPFGDTVRSLEAFDADGAGPQSPVMVAVGDFYSMGGVVANRIAARTGSTWTNLGGGLPDADFVNRAVSIPSPGGNDLYVLAYKFITSQSGQNGGVFRFSSGAWQPVGAPWGFAGSTGNAGYVLGLCTADFGTGSRLYAAGRFQSVDGTPTGHVASWNGSSWEQVGAPGAGITNGDVTSCVTFDSGSGTTLFIAGDTLRIGAGPGFTTVAKWNGTSWSNADTGLPPFVAPSLHKFNGALWAVVSDGGDQDAPKSLYRWNGSSWALQATSPFFDLTRFIGVANSGDGDRFYFASLDASLGFTGIGLSSLGLFEFDGTTWSDSSVLGRVTFDAPWDVEGIDANGEQAVWFAGPFAGVGGEALPNTVQTINAVDSHGIARFVRACAPTCPADLDNGTGAGTPDGGVDINDLLFFLAQFENGSPAADLDNGTGTGTPDGGVDINDLLFFLLHFEAGC